MSLLKILLVVLTFSCWGNAMSETLVDEVAAVRKNNRDAVIDITMIAGKYIPTEMSYLAARNLLESEGFQIIEVPTDGDYLQVIAKRKLETKGLLFHDEIKLVIDVRDGHVKNIRGKLIYRSL